MVGVANRKSVAWSVAKLLQSEGAEVLFSVRVKKKKGIKKPLSSERHIFTCDFEKPDEIENLAQEFEEFDDLKLDGVLHSIAFANYAEGMKPFHETKREDFLQATQISSFSLIELSRICKPYLTRNGSVVNNRDFLD